jgi:predicted secreted Zn-dependent protease
MSAITEEAEEGRASFQQATCATISGQHKVITQNLFDNHNHFDQRFDQLKEK